MLGPKCLEVNTDLKLCSHVPIVDFFNTWTFVTVFTSRHLGPNIWVLANGSKMICQPLGHLLGPGYWVQSQGSTSFLCILIFGTQILGPGTWIVDLLP